MSEAAGQRGLHGIARTDSPPRHVPGPPAALPGRRDARHDRCSVPIVRRLVQAWFRSDS